MSPERFDPCRILWMFKKNEVSEGTSVNKPSIDTVSEIDLEQSLGPPPDGRAIREWIEWIARDYLGSDVHQGLIDDFQARTLTIEEMEAALLAHKDQKLSGPILSRYDRSPSNRMLIYLPAARVVFCPIGKVANTAVKGWAIELSGRQVEADDVIHRLIDEKDVPLSVEAWTRWRFDQVKQDPSWAFVALVRDPAVRLVSAYWDKFVIHRTSGDTLQHTREVLEYVYGVESLQEEDVEQGISFRQFCHYLNSTPRRSIDSHWTAQHRYLENFHWDHLFDIDRVQDFESFVKNRCEPGYSEVSLGMRNAVPKHNQNEQGIGSLADRLPGDILSMSETRPSVEAFLTPDIKRFISDYYAMDYVLLKAARDQFRQTDRAFEGFKKLKRFMINLWTGMQY